jgi:hypothetical protein
MSTVTIDRSVTVQETADALKQKLGDRYEITTHGQGAQEALKVKQSAAALATVHLDQGGDTTTFHVHGGGLVISRMINEFGIAKRVAAAIEEAFKPAADSGHPCWRHLVADGHSATLTAQSEANQTRAFPAPVEPPASVA